MALKGLNDVIMYSLCFRPKQKQSTLKFCGNHLTCHYVLRLNLNEPNDNFHAPPICLISDKGRDSIYQNPTE